MNKKGIDVSVIEINVKLTEDKVVKIDSQIEDLSQLQKELTEQYQKEKDAKDELDNDKDWIRERAEENTSFYKLREVVKGIVEEKKSNFRR